MGPTQASGALPGAPLEEHPVAMWETDDQPNQGILPGNHISPASGNDPPSERSLRKRKRDLAGDSSNRSQSHFDRSNLPVDGQRQSQSIPYSQDSIKRAKVETFAPPSVTSPGSQVRVPLEGPGLPGELWQHVFKFLPPHSLGCALRVNKSFNLLLSPSQTELPVNCAALGATKYVHPNAIWAASRKFFHTGMPRPLFSMTELDMWRLILGKACQFCDKHPSSPVSSTTPWDSGPGVNGVRIIWPLGVRACGDCLQAHCEKVGELLQFPPDDSGPRLMDSIFIYRKWIFFSLQLYHLFLFLRCRSLFLHPRCTMYLLRLSVDLNLRPIYHLLSITRKATLRR